MEKKILYIDMDGVLANFEKAICSIDPNLHIGEGVDYDSRSLRVQEICKQNPSIFHDLEPIEGAVESVHKLFNIYDVLFLSTPLWSLPESYSGKRIWLDKHFGDKSMDRLILSKRKNLNIGHFLIDDTERNGVSQFKGEHIHFGTEKFRTWEHVMRYLENKHI